MHLIATVKQFGRKKPVLTGKLLEVPRPDTLRSLLASIVAVEVAAYNARAVGSADGEAPDAATLLAALSPEQIQDAADSGKVGFGLRYGATTEDGETAIANALQAFEDGLYRVFAGDRELADMDAPLALEENDSLTFIRLTMLTGRMW